MYGGTLQWRRFDRDEIDKRKIADSRAEEYPFAIDAGEKQSNCYAPAAGPRLKICYFSGSNSCFNRWPGTDLKCGSR